MISSPSLAGTSFVIALDIGTSSTRALVFDARGRKTGPMAQHPYGQTTTSDGGVETDADALLEWTARCLDEVAGELKVAPIAIAISCFWHSLMAVGQDDKPLTPLFSWADNRAAPYIAPLSATLDEAQAHARTGCVFHTSYWPAKLLWLHHARPQLFADQSVRWMSFAEYLALKWFGAARVSLSMASGTGLFNQNDCDWDAQTLAALPLDTSQLSPLCDADEPLGALLPAWRERWPLLARARWFPAVGDGACSNLGSGCVDASEMALNVGTSGALRVVLHEYSSPAPRGLWRYRIDRRRSIVGGALSNGGSVYAWVRNTLVLPSDAEAQIAAMEADAHGLTVLPFLAGERSPLWNAHARMVIAGATLDTSSTHILRACLEAASLRFSLVARLLQTEIARAATTEIDRTEIDVTAPGASMFNAAAPGAIENAAAEIGIKLRGDALRGMAHDDVRVVARGGALPPIIASGGALDKSACWRQIMCDCLGAPLVQSPEAEASARGAALLALEACGVIADVSDAPSARGATTLPDPTRHMIYARALERQNALYDQVFATPLHR